MFFAFAVALTIAMFSASYPVMTDSDQTHHQPQSEAQPSETPIDVAWAKKYVAEFDQLKVASKEADPSKQLPQQVAAKMAKALPMVMAQALVQAEQLLQEELYQWDIKPEHLDVWQISQDGHRLFSLMIEAMATKGTPDYLSCKGTRVFGEVRRTYTAADARVWGFVSIYLHKVGNLFKERLDLQEASCLEFFLKVLEDHLYMPIWALHQAAGQHELDSVALQAVQRILPHTTKIAEQTCDYMTSKFANYHSLSGALKDQLVFRSSVRDTEMFLIYLCRCVLEGSVQPVRSELFPLCIMLYPRLQVSWDLVREMLRAFRKVLLHLLSVEQFDQIKGYLAIMQSIYSAEVLGS